MLSRSSVVAALLTMCAVATAAAQEVIWLEGEQPTTRPTAVLDQADFPAASAAAAAWGRTDIMSGGSVLSVNLDPKQVDQFIGDDGLTFSYDFTLVKAGSYQIWARIGFEWARAAAECRINQQPWIALSPDQPTVNIQPIQTWNELAWLSITTAQLPAGKHTVSMRWPKTTTTKNDKTTTNRMLGALDCWCIAESFAPNGKFQPGQAYRNERDSKAAANKFTLPTAKADSRATVALTGLWECAAWEESYPVNDAERLSAITTLPDVSTLAWYSYAVPNDRNDDRPEMEFAHRWIARATIAVPAEAKGRSFILEFERFSAVASVFVNGIYCGFSHNHSTAWTCDISKAVKPGADNTIAVVFKDRYYSLSSAGEAMGNRRFWNTPNDFLSTNQGTASRHELAIAADWETGVTEPVHFTSVGTVYASDVFCQPLVSAGTLRCEVTVMNPTTAAVTTSVSATIQTAADQNVALTIPAVSVTVPAGSSTVTMLEAPFPNAQLWWPDQPVLYNAVTTVQAQGLASDRQETTFGYREWTWTKDHNFYLNGVRWQLFADLNYTNSKETFLERMKVSGMNQLRLWSNGGMYGMDRDAFLHWCDANGVIVRSSGTFDGQVANYAGGLSEGDHARTILFDNWREQTLAWVKAERNHPSVYIWSLENEVTYINSWNLGQAKKVEPAIRDVGKAVMALDPTRPVMVDGGNALLDESLPVNGAHYTEFMNATWGDFPDIAYTREHWYDPKRPQRGAWRMVPNRPIMKGEVYFAEGYGNDAFATIGGDRCFIGIGETYAARGLWGRMLAEGWRWGEVSSWHFWMGAIGGQDQQYWHAWQPVAVLCRQWNWTFGANQKVDRTLKVFNQTHDDAPIVVQWSWQVNGTAVAQGERSFELAPGATAEWPIEFTTTAPTTARAAATFTMQATRRGAVVYRYDIPGAILGAAMVTLPKMPATAITCYDPQGGLTAYLQKQGIAVTVVKTPDAIPATAKVVLVGSQALQAQTCADSTWMSLAAQGKRVVVLDQNVPLRYGGLPASAEPTDTYGCFAFMEDRSHPIFAGFEQADFFTWGGNHRVFHHAYDKPTSGGRSLVQGGNKLSQSAVFECPVGDGLLIISQLNMTEHLVSEGVAQAVLQRLVTYAWNWVPVRRDVVTTCAVNSPQGALLAAIGVASTVVKDPLAALKGSGIAIIPADPATLKTLVAQKSTVRAFCERGGWLMLWGLTPDGLADYNTIVGYQHAIRPFDTERVVLASPTDPLSAGLTLRDVVMDTGEKMYPWMALKKPDSDAFTYMIDHTDIAPFCVFPTPTEMGKGTDTPGVDHYPRNLVNGFTSDDNWSFTYTTAMDLGHKRSMTLTLPREEELISLKVRTSSLYHPVTRIDIRFDEDPTPVSAELRAEALVQEIPIAGRRATKITLEIAGWEERGDKNIVVLDNLWLNIKRSDDYLNNAASLLNVGALMRYKIGKGGIFLNQVNVLPSERNPVNAEKKQAIVRTILGNLGAPFAASGPMITGAGATYTPIVVPDASFNAYVHHRGQPGWFPGTGDMSALPVGNQRFAQVAFAASDFSTSPVPSAWMIAGPGSQVKDVAVTIPMQVKADVLYVLHTANPGPGIERYNKQRDEAERRNRAAPELPVLAQYRIHYQDGTEVVASIVWARDIGAWSVAEPVPLPQAQLGWIGAKGDDGLQSVVYVWKWDNPHPEREITGFTIEPSDAKGKIGTPAVFAITAATKAAK